MSTEIHPETGVELNCIDVVRPALDFDDAVTVHMMKARGEKYQLIAQKLGTNPARIGEVLRCEAHPGAAAEAVKLLTQM